MMIIFLCSLLYSYYIESRFESNVAKSQEWWHLIVPEYDDIRFKKIMRMDSQSFQNLITNIEAHSIFQSTGNKKQAPVELQLAIFYEGLVQRMKFLVYAHVMVYQKLLFISIVRELC